jgi:DNA-binding LacI/PurR family transcriptional regulator
MLPTRQVRRALPPPQHQIPPRSQPTLRDVARLAGVSPTTVSDALNGRGRVDDDTRRRVAEAARAVGYGGAQEAAPASRTIGLALPEVVGSRGALSGVDVYLRVSAGAGDAALEAGHGLLLLPSRRPRDLERYALDGAIVVDPEVADARLMALDELGVPTVTLERDAGRPDRPWWVNTDTAANQRLLLDHLEERGARVIALMSADSTWGWVAAQEAAYTAWCAARRLQPLLVRTRPDTAADAAAALLDRPDRPDGVICLSTPFVVPLLEAARERGLAVPGDLLVASGIDGADIDAADPPVTAIDVAPEAQARAAMEMLLARLEGRPTDETRVLPAELVVRASTGR